MRILILTYCLLAALVLGAQSPVFKATTQARQVVENGVFEVQFTLENAEGRDFQAPSFGGFKVISGPSMSLSTSIINGKMTSSRSYTYTLMAGDRGTFAIPPAQITVGNRTLRSNSLTIEVVEGKQEGGGAGSDDADVFVKAEIDTAVIYPGQQLRVDYKIYTTVNIRNYNAVSEDDYAEFYYRYVQDFDRRSYLEVVDGVQYKVQTLRSIALFGQKAGEYRIDPFVVQVGIGVRDDRRSFFFNTRTIPRTLSTDPLTVRVRDLPEPAPEAFTGAVGDYEMAVQINRNQLSTDDALVLTVQLTGDGDAKRWTPPSLDYLSDQFEMYPPKIVEDNSTDAGGLIRNRKVIEYILIPRETGTLRFTADFTYFNPDSTAYLTLTSRPIEVQVTRGTHTQGVAAIDIGGQEERQFAGLKSPTRLPRRRGAFRLTVVHGVLALLPFLLLGILVVFKKRHEAFASLDPSEKRRLRARKVALRYLEEAKQHLHGSDREFYDAISRSIIGYISGRLNISPSSLTKENLSAAMERAGVPAAHREEALSVIRQGEVVLYAGASGGPDHREVYERVLRLITEMEI